MQVSIAVATASGRAYYQLVSELKKRRIAFITVKPDETVPLNIEVAITTESEKSRVRCPTVLTYDERTDPSTIIEEALQIIRGKHRYSNLIVGVDPGKDFGMAAVGDGAVLETKSVSGAKEAAVEVLRMMERYEGDRKAVKIGNGADIYRMKLITGLDKMLPLGVDMESVEEQGTTKNVNALTTRRSTKDASSAIKISMRKGRKIARRKEWTVS